MILSSPTMGQEESATETETHDDTQSGNDDLPYYGGPEGVNQSLKRDEEDRDSTPFPDFPCAIFPWLKSVLSHDPLDWTGELVRQHEGVCRTVVVCSNQTDYQEPVETTEMQSQYLSLKTKITTTKLNETRIFYEGLFSMVAVDEWNDPDDKGVILSFDRDRHDALLEIFHDDERRDHSGVSLQFRVSDIGKFIAGLPADVVYEGPKERPWGSTYVYIRDPNDILLIVYEGGR